MPDVHFDSFGERIPQAPSHGANDGQASRRVLLAATGIFWTLVVVFVSARAFYFDPDVTSTFARFANQSSRLILSLLGG